MHAARGGNNYNARFRTMNGAIANTKQQTPRGFGRARGVFHVYTVQRAARALSAIAGCESYAIIIARYQAKGAAHVASSPTFADDER